MNGNITHQSVILIVDDTPMNLEMLLDFLEDAGFKVVVAEDGESAIEMVEYAPPDLILLDILMPRLDGFETCRRLKNNPKTQHIPIIFMTALIDKVDKIKGLTLGAVDYITKPLEHEEVLARINIHLRLQNLTQKLVEQNERLTEQAALLNITTDAVIVRDLDDKISFWNQGAERLYGWLKSEAIGKNINKLLYKKNLVSQPQSSWTNLIKYGAWESELHQITKENKDIIVLSRWTLMRDTQGEPKSILIVNTDITEKKKLQAQFLRAQRLESIGTLASGIAHDLNNILTPILGIAQILPLKFPDLDERTQELLKILEDNSKRGSALIKQVLSFARGMEGKRTILQVSYVLSEIQQMLRQTFPKSIEIRTNIAPDLRPVYGDTTQLHQVFMNLVLNARDAMPNGGSLTLGAENLFVDENYARMNLGAKVGLYTVITVTDTGTGISHEVLDRIFEPFFTTKEHGKGSGLGLSTALSIIKTHNGFLTIDSTMGKGTIVKVYLPAQEVSQPFPSENLELPNGHRELLLLVDDEAGIRETTKILLEKYNYQVLTASDGIEAIELYAQYKQDINLILMDLMMPLMDGETAIRALQKMNPEVKIIAISGLISSEKLSQEIKVTTDAYLPKPYTAQELLTAIDLTLSSSVVSC